MRNTRAHWGSRLGFVLATAGSAIGLGNIWKFPYITGVNGGGAFVLIYLVCIGIVGIPIFIAELHIGQKAQCNAVQAFEVLHKKDTWWRAPGWLGLASAFIILSFYSVVGGWILDFLFRASTGELSPVHLAATEGLLDRLFADPWRQLFWHALFMGLTTAIVLGGVKAGLERWNKILMPGLLILLGLLLVHCTTLPGFSQALSFLFSMDTSKLTASGVLEAAGHAFFTLSLGMGAVLTYGSYLGRKENLPRVALIVALMDTMIALIAGLIIFSIVFSFGLEPGRGPGLIFHTLPPLFAQMPGGHLIAIAFFALVSFAAITSSVSMLEVVVTYWDETHKVERRRGTLLSSCTIFVMGLLSVFSTNLLANFKPFFGLTFFDFFDRLTSSYLLPIGGILIALYFGWVLGEKAVDEVLGPNSPRPLRLGLLWSARILTPLAVILIIINNA